MLPELPRELWAKILLMVAEYTGPYSGTDEYEGDHLAGLMLVCHRWEEDAASAVYSSVSIDSSAGLRGLATRFRHNTRTWPDRTTNLDTRMEPRSTRAWKVIGQSIMKLTIIELHEESSCQYPYAGYLNTILRNAPNLKEFIMRNAPITTGMLNLLPAFLTHLEIEISPAHVDAFEMINSFKHLKYLSLCMKDCDEEGSFHHSFSPEALDPMVLPTVKEFIFSHEDEDDSGLAAVLRYIARSRLQIDCKFFMRLRRCDPGTFLLLNPLFEYHASKEITLPSSCRYLTSKSKVFSRAQSICLFEWPPAEMFGAACLPDVIEIFCDNGHEDVNGSDLRAILDVIVDSPHSHETRLILHDLCWKPAFQDYEESSYFWQINFVGMLLFYVGPLSRKGVSLVDGDGKTFQDCFKDVF